MKIKSHEGKREGGKLHAKMKNMTLELVLNMGFKISV